VNSAPMSSVTSFFRLPMESRSTLEVVEGGDGEGDGEEDEGGEELNNNTDLVLGRKEWPGGIMNPDTGERYKRYRRTRCILVIYGMGLFVLFAPISQ